MTETKNVKITFVPTIPAAIAFILIELVTFYLFFGRNVPSLRLPFFLTIAPEFYTHVSNFSLSLSTLVIFSFIWLSLGVPFRYIIALAGMILGLNFLVETWVFVLNIPDLIDAYYGASGVTIGVLFLVWVKFYGLKLFQP
ncbi:hypothetical protein A0256_03415 [Mucilaginibacter sp. PAMC 26640]|nr:hypothetical protein A0256_03415 [Mucilaginibacter sp. PAMC 26640]